MKLHTKGFATTLFKWIFAVVAGAILFIFLVQFAFQQQGTADKVDERKLIIGLEHQLEALATTDVASKTIPIKREVNLQFDCDGIKSNTYRRSTSKVLFAPPQVKGNTLQTWVSQWQFPFRAGSFYYVTNQKAKTLLITDATTEGFVRDLTIPQTLNIQSIDIQNFDPRQLAPSFSGLDAVTLVFFTPRQNVQSVFQELPRIPLIVAVVNPTTHTVKIHTRGSTEETYYLGESMLYGLFIAPENYVCLKDKALTRYRDLLGLYEQKVVALQAKLGNKPHCQAQLREAQTVLRTFRTVEGNEQLHDHKTSLEQQNANLARQDCPTIY